MLHHFASTFASPFLCQRTSVCVHLSAIRRFSPNPTRKGRLPSSSQAKKRLGSRFEQPKTVSLEDILVPQRVTVERHTEVEFDNVDQNLSYQFISNILDRFAREPHIRELAAEQYITKAIFDKAFQSFRLYCCCPKRSNLLHLEPALRVTFSDIKNQEQSIDSIYPFFKKHAYKVFPHLECIRELRQISDLTQPHNWYPLAREIRRKVVFHAGPTNSGKTYEALQVFKKADSGFYCGPLRLLAFEVYERINREGVACDMITGEQRLYASGDPENPARHSAHTVEMLSPEDRREVCVIDEIQMLRDPIRGAAWTRALLGSAVDEIHLCGEESAIDIVYRLLDPIGEHVDVRRYKRKGDLVVVTTHGLRDLQNAQDGDCIIHFNKTAILAAARKLKQEQKREAAVIFGDLPAETKRAQISRFNDPDDPCKLLLATDAVGMGMNLNIKRVIFTQLITQGQVLPSYFVKQIAGRAGRFASRYCTGEVMAMQEDDIALLKRLMDEPIRPIEQAGIAPSYEMIELFSIHLPHCSLIQLLEIFESICTVSDGFFVCMADQMKELANLIEHIPLSLRDRYTFCLCPVNSMNRTFLTANYVKMVRRYSQGNAITYNWLQPIVAPEMKPVNTVEQLTKLVDVHDLLYAYLWLSYRLPEYFSHRDNVRQLQSECREIIDKSLEKMIGIEVNKMEQIPFASSSANRRQQQQRFDIAEEADKSLGKTVGIDPEVNKTEQILKMEQIPFASSSTNSNRRQQQRFDIAFESLKRMSANKDKNGKKT